MNGSKYAVTVNISRLAELARNMDTYTWREDWSEVADAAERIIKLATECKAVADEEIRKQWEE